IQWLDADDLMSPDKIERQMAVAAKYPNRRMLLSGPWGSFLYRPSRADFAPSELWQDLSPVEWLRRKLALNLHMQTATWLVSRELTEAAGPWDPKQARDNDGEYFRRVLLASDGVRFVAGANVYYRATGMSSVSYIGRSNKKMEALWRSMRLHIESLRSLDDSPRTREACVIYLQNWLLQFYPERLDIVEEAERLAVELGGRLERPRLSWKYTWIRAMFGWRMAKLARLYLPEMKWSVIRSFDRLLYQMELRSAGGV